MKIWHVPIEPYETRYTADWVQQFEKEFENNNIEYETILGVSTQSKLGDGLFLDVCGTNIYKFSQLNILLEKLNAGLIKDDDIIFFADGWFPGLESIFYVRNMLNLKFKVAAIYHAGTWDKWDRITQNGMRSWGKFQEAAWFEGLDYIFVATDFHKHLIIDNQGTNEYNHPKMLQEKIRVTGIPFYYKDFEKYIQPKEKIVVFPHRNAIEKHPELFEKLSHFPGLEHYKFINTLNATKTREEYFNLLGKAQFMVSFAEQETFGYSTVEAMACGCNVIVPDALSYKETVPRGRRYEVWQDRDEWVIEVANLMRVYENHINCQNYSQDLQYWEGSIERMINILKGKE